MQHMVKIKLPLLTNTFYQLTQNIKKISWHYSKYYTKPLEKFFSNNPNTMKRTHQIQWETARQQCQTLDIPRVKSDFSVTQINVGLYRTHYPLRCTLSLMPGEQSIASVNYKTIKQSFTNVFIYAISFDGIMCPIYL